MIFDYPYTDMHELNLDWFLAKFKEYYEHITEQDQKITNLEETVEQFTTFVTNYFDNLDVQEEINHKMDVLVANGTISTLLAPLVDEYNQNIINIVNNQNGRINVLESRMDDFSSLEEGSTTGDAELMDIRVGLNSVTYPNAGDAVRGQIGNIINAINSFAVDLTSIADNVQNIYIENPGGAIGVHSSANWNTYVFNRNDIEAINTVMSYSATNTNTLQIAFWLSDTFDIDNYISGYKFVTASDLNTITGIIPIPDTTVVITISNRASSGDPVIVGYPSGYGAILENIAANMGSYKNDRIRDIFYYNLKSKNRMLFSAHRGAEGQAPYGSYPAYKLACEQGWDILQIAQARQSADGTWYCIHDADVANQTNGTGNIQDLTDAYIDTIYQDVGVNVDQYTHDEMKLPKLEDVLKLAYRYGLLVSIRMGSLVGNPITPEQTASWTSFINLCKKYNPEKMIFSGTKAQVDTLKAKTDNWHGNIYLTSDTFYTTVDACVAAGYTNISIMIANTLMDADRVKYLHDRGYQWLCPQILNSVFDDYLTLSNIGCDIAQTGLSPIHSLA